MTHKPTVVVVGGGITGLSAAHILAGLARVVLIEADAELGGKIRTERFRDRVVDVGPDSFITRNRSAFDLCRALDLDLIAPGTSRASIYARGALRPFPQGIALGIPTQMSALRRSNTISMRGWFRSILDLVNPCRINLREDPSVAELIGSRFGNEVLATLVDPLLGGINASDVGRLSFGAAAPQLASKIDGRRSLARSLRQSLTPISSEPTSGSDEPPLFVGVARGMTALVEQLRDRCVTDGVEILTSSPVTDIQLSEPGGAWVIEIGDRSIQSDGLVLCTPAYQTAQLLRSCASELANECAGIPYADVANLIFAFKKASIGQACGFAPLDGSGALVPRSPDTVITAMTFTSTKWPRSARDDEVVIRAFVGRHNDIRATALSDENLLRRVLEDLRNILGIDEPPLETLLTRWPQSFPQYVTGHGARIARIDRLTHQLPAFAVAGSAYNGIGIPACIDSGSTAARRVAGALL